MIYIFQGYTDVRGGMDIDRLLVVADSEEEAREKAAPYLAEQERLESERIAWYDRAWRGVRPRDREYTEAQKKFGPVPPGRTGPVRIGALLETYDDIYVVQDCIE